MTLDSGSALPLYQQVYEYLKAEITTGKIKAGEKLPSKRALAAHLRISRNTVETTYEQLTAEGYVRAMPRSGYYVCKTEEPGSDRDLFRVAAQKAGRPSADHTKASTPLDPEDDEHPEQPCRFDFTTQTVDTSFFPFATWARLAKEIMSHDNREILRLSHPQGDYALRESMAQYLHAFRGVNCRPEQVIVGAGTEYLLGLIIQILGSNRIYAVENPGYAKTRQILISHERDVCLVGLDEDGIRMQDLVKTQANTVYVTPSHHYPLGLIMPVARRMQLLAWAGQSDEHYIIEDDYDSEFRFSGRPVPALQGLDTQNKVIYVSTFSKSIAPSIRISYMVLPPVLLEKYQQNYGFYASSVSRFEQHIVQRFIQDGHFERHLRRMRNIYRSRKEKLVEELRKLPDSSRIEIMGENAGLHLLLKIDNGLSEQELTSRARAVGIRLYGLSEYYMDPETDRPVIDETSGDHSQAGSQTDPLLNHRDRPQSFASLPVIILGYSSFSPEEMTEAVSLLGQAWFKTPTRR